MNKTQPQPPPTGHGTPVLDVALSELNAWHPEAFCFGLGDFLIARAEAGLKKYGTELRTHNGRDAAVDALQELGDAYMYLTQAEMEHCTVEGARLRLDVLDVLVRLWGALEP